MYSGVFLFQTVAEYPNLRGRLHGGRPEDPRRQKNFSFSLHAVILAEVVTKWRRKRKITVGLKQLNARLPPLLFFLFLVLGSSEGKKFTWC